MEQSILGHPGGHLPNSDSPQFPTPEFVLSTRSSIPGDWAAAASADPLNLSPVPVPERATTNGANWLNRLGQQAIAESPPWLTSILLHLVALIILAVLLLPGRSHDQLTIDAVFADRIGDQTEELIVSLDKIDVADEQTFDASVVEMPKIDTPLFSPPELTLSEIGAVTSHTADAPQIALALTGREPGRKDALLQAFGGTAETELAVSLGLQWLARYQRREGYWSLKGPYQSGAMIENREAATGMALLAFQGAGNTAEGGRYKDLVAQGWHYLLQRQQNDGCFYRAGDFNHRFYTQAICTLGICELYGMSRDPALQIPAQNAVDYLVTMQSPLGGWRYDPAVDADTSVTGWVVLALQSAQSAGLQVPSKVFDRINRYLDLASSYDGSRYGYKPGHGESLSMTAEGLLCRQYLGWKKDDPRLADGVSYLQDHPIQYRDANIYYWYYATQVMHHMEGDLWNAWNQVLRTDVPQKQLRGGREEGSWYIPDDRWGVTGGRLFTTCLHIYMLEVYYRHLPIYSPVFRFETPPAEGKDEA